MKRQICYFVIVVSIMTVSITKATPVVDGTFDMAEGYTSGNYVCLDIEKAGPISERGQLWFHQDTAHNLYGSLVLPRTLVDNTYGDNSIGWGQNAPSGKRHNFKDLKGSDSAQFRIYDGQGDIVLDFVLDYISSSTHATSGYASGGVTYGEGKVQVGSDSDLLAWGSSLDYNLNILGHVLTENSPATDSQYTENPLYPDWQYTVTYEFKVDGDVFGGKGVGDIEVPLMHISPNKLGANKAYGQICEPIPEPATISMLALGGIAMLRKRRQ